MSASKANELVVGAIPDFYMLICLSVFSPEESFQFQFQFHHHFFFSEKLVKTSLCLPSTTSAFMFDQNVNKCY